MQCLLNASPIEHEVQSSLDHPSPTHTPPDQGTTAGVEVKPVEVKPDAEPVTFRVFHQDVFKGHQGQGFVDVYDPRWASGQSELVSHVTVDAEATYEKLQRKVLSQMRQTGNSTQNLLFIMTGSIPNAPALRNRSLDTKMHEMRCHYPLRCLWLVTLPSRELADQILAFRLTCPIAQGQLCCPSSNESETINTFVASNETTPMDVMNPNPEDESEDVEMEDDQDEGPEVVPVDDATATQGGPTNLDTPQPSSTDRSVTVASSHVDHFLNSNYTYILIKHYDSEQQSLTGLCGIAAKSNEKVKEAVEKVLLDLAFPKVSDASEWTIWKEVSLDYAQVIEPYRTFGNEGLMSGSIIILQNKLSAEE